MAKRRGAECSTWTLSIRHRLSSNPLNRTNQQNLFDKISQRTDIDQSESGAGIGADVLFCSGWKGFDGFVCRQGLPQNYRIVPNLAGSVLFASGWHADLAAHRHTKLAISALAVAWLSINTFCSHWQVCSFIVGSLCHYLGVGHVVLARRAMALSASV